MIKRAGMWWKRATTGDDVPPIYTMDPADFITFVILAMVITCVWLVVLPWEFLIGLFYFAIGLASWVVIVIAWQNKRDQAKMWKEIEEIR